MNNTSVLPSVTNWVQVLEHQVRTGADKLAISELSSDLEQSKQLSYFEFTQRAKALAVELSKHTSFGDRVLLVMPSSVDYVIGFFACVYAGVIAVTAYPPHLKKRDWYRLNAIAGDCQPAIVLYSQKQSAQVDNWLASTDFAMEKIIVGEQDINNAGQWRQGNIDENDLVYLQYSSGSTGTPKGVMLSHANLLSNTRLIAKHYGMNQAGRIINWLPLFHDMGLVGCILTPMLAGTEIVLMQSASVAQNPLKLLTAISQHKATITAGPNFIFDLATNRISAEEKAQLDLSSLQAFVNGAEPINAQTIKDFTDYFADAGLAPNAVKPSYGMAEACLMVTCTGQEQSFSLLSVDKVQLQLDKAINSVQNAQEIAASGTIIPGLDVRIIHQDTRVPLPDTYVGEIMFRGDSVCRGYWQKPELNSKTFDQVIDGEPGYMCSGDLGFIKDNQLFVTGRRKEMFIINGRNFYPQDLEKTATGIGPELMIHGGAVFEIPGEDPSENRLVLVQELSRKGLALKDHSQLIKNILSQVAEVHEVKLTDIVLLRPMALPKTTSGKIQRVGCREAYLSGQLTIVAQWQQAKQESNNLQALPQMDGGCAQSIAGWITAWVAQRFNVPAEEVTQTQELSQLGLDSIDAMTLTHELSVRLNKALTADLSWTYPSIEALATFLANKDHDSQSSGHSEPLEGVI
ncbi:AMP-binding protein [Thalassomonas viridans]|uniref:AMP-binding protein n=1 Tax=Thalassomonas viridans TaxID=137584 RepID=A0AAE9Z4F1_9GAMM|nr:AMP-binding protein [Thalassomonas viridans]WDE06112.1 AMP-binding protein [Thalassomonas viridans]